MNGDQVLSGAETATLLTLIDARLARMEDRIISRLDHNAAGAADRWRLHDEQLERNTALVTAKFVEIEERLDAHLVIANEHFGRQHDDDVRMDGRVRPVRVGFAWLGSNYKNLLVAVFAVLGFLLGFLAIVADLASRYLGGGT
jgi:hypothetical protein